MLLRGRWRPCRSRLRGRRRRPEMALIANRLLRSPRSYRPRLSLYRNNSRLCHQMPQQLNRTEDRLLVLTLTYVRSHRNRIVLRPAVYYLKPGRKLLPGRLSSKILAPFWPSRPLCFRAVWATSSHLRRLRRPRLLRNRRPRKSLILMRSKERLQLPRTIRGRNCWAICSTVFQTQWKRYWTGRRT